MKPNELSQGKLLWSGEHWIAYPRDPETAEETAMISLYSAYASPAGRGTAAFVEIPGGEGFKGLCTDNVKFAEFVRDTQVIPSSPFERTMDMMQARFSRDDEASHNPTWLIETGTVGVRVGWTELTAPIVGPPVPNPKILFTILIFAENGFIHLNGTPVAGKPYQRDVWRPMLGNPGSSFCYALAETAIH